MIEKERDVMCDMNEYGNKGTHKQQHKQWYRQSYKEEMVIERQSKLKKHVRQ